MNNLRTAEERNTFESWVSIGATIESKVNNSQVDVRGYFVDADGFVDRIRPVPCTIEDVNALLELVNNSPLISEQELTNIMRLIPSTKEIQANQILFYIHSLHLTVANAKKLSRDTMTNTMTMTLLKVLETKLCLKLLMKFRSVTLVKRRLSLLWYVFAKTCCCIKKTSWKNKPVSIH
jgi:hypothetical protein